MPQIPAVDYLVLEGKPHLQAHECVACQALYFDRRNACAKCSGREFGLRALAREGTLRAFTIVHRAAPGVTAPYTSAVVDLDGGGVVKANLLGVVDPEVMTPQLRVRLATFVAGTDDDGVEAIAFGFEAVSAAGQSPEGSVADAAPAPADPGGLKTDEKSISYEPVRGQA